MGILKNVFQSLASEQGNVDLFKIFFPSAHISKSMDVGKKLKKKPKN